MALLFALCGMVNAKNRAEAVVNNPKAVVALANRIGGAGTAKKFKFVLDPSLNAEQEAAMAAEHAELGSEKDATTVVETVEANMNGSFEDNIADAVFEMEHVKAQPEVKLFCLLSNKPQELSEYVLYHCYAVFQLFQDQQT